MARHIIDAMQRESAGPPIGLTAEEKKDRAEPAPVVKPQPKPMTLTVDLLGRGDYSSVTEALQAASPGARILVRPGLYLEGILIDKAIEIIGDGNLGEVVIEAVGMNAVCFRANMGRIVNLTLRQLGGGEWYCVDIGQGMLSVEECDITSQSLSSVGIHGGADPRLLRNRISDGTQSGVFVYDDGRGTLEHNEISGNAYAAVAIKTGGSPTLRENRIFDGLAGGILVYEGGKGRLEQNEIFANSGPEVEVLTGGDPAFRGNRIWDGRTVGIYVHDNGQGVFENNEVTAIPHVGVAVTRGGKPIFRRNLITKNEYQAIWISEAGGGEFEENDLRGNASGASQVSFDSTDKVIRRRNLEW